VTFGNETKATSLLCCVQLGESLGKTAIVDNCVNTILSVPLQYDLCTMVKTCDVTFYIKIMKLSTFLFLIKTICLSSINIQDLINVKVKSQQINATKIRKTKTNFMIVFNIKLPLLLLWPEQFDLEHGQVLTAFIHPSIIEKVYQHQNCLSCLLGKINRLPHTEGSSVKPNIFAKVVAVDWKPVTPISSWGHSGFYFSPRRKCELQICCLSCPKFMIAIIFVLRLACEVMRNYFNKHGPTLSTIRCDSGTIENSESVSQQLAEKFSIRIESASPECQYQNPCERGIQTLAKGVGAMFCRQTFLGNKTWNLAVFAWSDASNVCPNETSGEYSPEYFL
jgi:hypothetical protein